MAEAPEPHDRSPYRWGAPLAVLLALFVVSRVWLLDLTASTPPSYDVAYYGILAQHGVDLGETAYRDFQVEYPPVAWWLMAVPRLIDKKAYPHPVDLDDWANPYFSSYSAWFRGELFLIDLANLGLAVAIGRKVSPRAWWFLPAVYILSTVAQPHVVYDRLDVGLLLFFLLFIYCWLKSLAATSAAGSWADASYLFLGLGISYKIMPVFFPPFLLLADWRTLGGSLRFARRCLLLLLGALGPFLLEMSWAGWDVLQLFQYHGERDIHLESTWASIVLFAGKFGLQREVELSHGGLNLLSPWSTSLEFVSNAAIVAMVCFFGLWAFAQRQRLDRRAALDVSCLVLVNTVALAKVYSPQYLIWLIPLALILALDVFPPSRVMWGVFAALVVSIVEISAWLFPHHYRQLNVLEPLPVDLVIARSGALVALALTLDVAFFARHGLWAPPVGVRHSRDARRRASVEKA